MNATAVWIGQFGEYPIPPEFAAVRIRKNGWPDKRSQKVYKAMMAWVQEQEAHAFGGQSTVDPGRSDHG